MGIPRTLYTHNMFLRIVTVRRDGELCLWKSITSPTYLHESKQPDKIPPQQTTVTPSLL